MNLFRKPGDRTRATAKRTLADFEALHPQAPQRHVAERSSLEVHRLREAAGNELSAAVYFFDQRLIVASPVVGLDGEIHAELVQPFVRQEPVDDDQLGELAMNALLAFIAEKPPSLRDRKKSDWPAFKASGARTIDQFERKSIEVAIRTQYTSLLLEAHPVKSLEHHRGIYAHCSPSVLHVELGAEMRHLVRGVEALRERGVV